MLPQALNKANTLLLWAEYFLSQRLEQIFVYFSFFNIVAFITIKLGTHQPQFTCQINEDGNFKAPFLASSEWMGEKYYVK